MPVTDAYLCIVDSKSSYENVVDLIDRFIHRSRQAALFCPKRTVQIAETTQIEKSLKKWPMWCARPWIVAGMIDESKASLHYEGAFIDDTKIDEQYEEFVSRLLQKFDWAVFSYFTTYHDEYFTLLTPHAHLASEVLGSVNNVVSRCSGAQPLLPKLKNMSYMDYGEEGWLPYELALERGEGKPLVLSRIELCRLETYCRWNNEIGEYEGKPWFETPLGQMELVKDFGIIKGDHYFLHRAIAEKPYVDLWAMTSYDHAAAQASFSFDCDIENLDALLRSENYFDVIKHGDRLATWVYGTVYGGGAGEHHAVFHSRDPSATHRLWELAGKNRISRF